MTTGQETAHRVQSDEAAMAARPGRSFRDVLASPRTFKPRFPKDSSHQLGDQVWLQEDSWKASRHGTASVWGRLRARRSSIHDRLGPSRQQFGVGMQQSGGHLLSLLKAKAGVRRCFNCLASDHRISQCRDPPTCILCSRSGHKARFCPRASIHQLRPTPDARPLPLAASSSPVPAAPASLPASPPGVSGAGALPSPLAQQAMDPFSVPGSPGNRPFQVVAAAARCQAMREVERELEIQALVAVQMDARIPLSCAVVRRDALHQLRIPPEDILEVRVMKPALFLVRFSSRERRNAALNEGGFCSSGSGLRFMPWSRRFGATAGSLKFRVRVCLEGVPDHGRQVETVAQLLSPPSFIDEVDCTVEKEEERSTFNMWVWTDAPSNIATSGILQIEETA